MMKSVWIACLVLLLGWILLAESFSINVLHLQSKARLVQSVAVFASNKPTSNEPNTFAQYEQNRLTKTIQSTLPIALSLFSFLTIPTPSRRQSLQAKPPPNAYLTEPTERFQEELAKKQQYDSQRAKARDYFDNLLNDFTLSTTSEDLKKNLLKLEEFLTTLGDMPVGIKKNDIVKACRYKKFDPNKKGRRPKRQINWTDEVESAYVKLILKIDNLISPEAAVRSGVLSSS